MRIFGLSIVPTRRLKSLISGAGARGWWPLIRESSAGAWQRNETIRFEDTLSYWPVFRCVSLISSDIGKLGVNVVEEGPPGIWTPRNDPQASPLLAKPNRYQTRIQFFENWLQSKLTRGNTYILKQRGEGNMVTALYVLDPSLVTVRVAENGDVFYDLNTDYISGLRREAVTVPASEIIHDRWNAFYHPLCGLSPIYAAGIMALNGLRIQQTSSKFFEKGALPSGILSSDRTITDDTAERLKRHWQENFTGVNAGRVAVLGDGLRYERMTVTAEDSQLIEQLKWTAETICGVFGVPVYMVMGTPPTYNNVQALTQQYYSQCLQVLIESIEVLLDEGLGLADRSGRRLGVMFDLGDLLRMDSATMADVESKLVGSGIASPNESRRKFNLPPVEGGETPWLQQQNWPIGPLSQRTPPTDENPNPSPDDDPELEGDERSAALRRGVERRLMLAA